MPFLPDHELLYHSRLLQLRGHQILFSQLQDLIDADADPELERISNDVIECYWIQCREVCWTGFQKEYLAEVAFDMAVRTLNEESQDQDDPKAETWFRMALDVSGDLVREYEGKQDEDQDKWVQFRQKCAMGMSDIYLEEKNWKDLENLLDFITKNNFRKRLLALLVAVHLHHEEIEGKLTACLNSQGEISVREYLNRFRLVLTALEDADKVHTRKAFDHPHREAEEIKEGIFHLQINYELTTREFPTARATFAKYVALKSSYKEETQTHKKIVILVDRAVHHLRHNGEEEPKTPWGEVVAWCTPMVFMCGMLNDAETERAFLKLLIEAHFNLEQFEEAARLFREHKIEEKDMEFFELRIRLESCYGHHDKIIELVDAFLEKSEEPGNKIQAVILRIFANAKYLPMGKIIPVLETILSKNISSLDFVTLAEVLNLVIRWLSEEYSSMTNQEERNTSTDLLTKVAHYIGVANDKLVMDMDHKDQLFSTAWQMAVDTDDAWARYSVLRVASKLVANCSRIVYRLNAKVLELSSALEHINRLSGDTTSNLQARRDMKSSLHDVADVMKEANSSKEVQDLPERKRLLFILSLRLRLSLEMGGESLLSLVRDNVKDPDVDAETLLAAFASLQEFSDTHEIVQIKEELLTHAIRNQIQADKAECTAEAVKLFALLLNVMIDSDHFLDAVETSKHLGNYLKALRPSLVPQRVVLRILVLLWNKGVELRLNKKKKSEGGKLKKEAKQLRQFAETYSEHFQTMDTAEQN